MAAGTNGNILLSWLKERLREYIYICACPCAIYTLIIICQRTRRRHNVATISGRRYLPAIVIQREEKYGKNRANKGKIKQTHILGSYVESSENASLKGVRESPSIDRTGMFEYV